MEDFTIIKDKTYKGYIIYLPMYAKCDAYKVQGTFYEWVKGDMRGLWHIEKSTPYNENGIQTKELIEL